jgi:hypothetical protein
MGIATSLLFRWRVQLGLTARKAPQLTTVTLADDMANEVPTLAALRDLVRPPDGMMAIELGDGRRVFAPEGSSPADVKRQLAGNEKTRRSRSTSAGSASPALLHQRAEVAIVTQTKQSGVTLSAIPLAQAVQQPFFRDGFPFSGSASATRRARHPARQPELGRCLV